MIGNILHWHGGNIRIMSLVDNLFHIVYSVSVDDQGNCAFLTSEVGHVLLAILPLPCQAQYKLCQTQNKLRHGHKSSISCELRHTHSIQIHSITYKIKYAWRTKQAEAAWVFLTTGYPITLHWSIRLGSAGHNNRHSSADGALLNEDTDPANKWRIAREWHSVRREWSAMRPTKAKGSFGWQVICSDNTQLH